MFKLFKKTLQWHQLILLALFAMFWTLPLFNFPAAFYPSSLTFSLRGQRNTPVAQEVFVVAACHLVLVTQDKKSAIETKTLWPKSRLARPQHSLFSAKTSCSFMRREKVPKMLRSSTILFRSTMNRSKIINHSRGGAASGVRSRCETITAPASPRSGAAYTSACDTHGPSEDRSRWELQDKR